MFHLLLIVGQFVLSAVIVLSSSWSPVPWSVLLLGLPGALLAVWAWLTMGLPRLRVHPTTTEKTRLITDGPYGLVRHPMYTGLLWFTAALLLSGIVWWRFAVWLSLLIVLNAKAREEETAMLDQFPSYSDYRSKVGRLVPRLPLGRNQLDS